MKPLANYKIEGVTGKFTTEMNLAGWHFEHKSSNKGLALDLKHQHLKFTTVVNLPLSTSS